MKNIVTLFLFSILTGELMAQWSPTNGPYGYNISTTPNGIYETRHTVLSIEKSGSTLLAGIPGGIFSSSNNGNTWQRVLQVDSAYALKVNGSLIFAGTNTGFYYSSNNGASWTQSNSGLSNLSLLSLSVIGNTLIAGTQTGIFISSNNGINWSFSSIGIPSTPINAILVTGTNIIAGTNQGVYISTNNASTWSAINNGFASPQRITSFAINGTNIFAASSSTNSIFKTINNGANWTVVNNGLPLNSPTNFVGSVGGKIFTGGENSPIYQSSNNGTNWTTNYKSFSGLNFGGTKTFFSDGTNLYEGGLSGLNMTSDLGITWSHLGLGKANQVNAIASNPSKLFAATESGIYYTSDDGNTWSKSFFSGISFTNSGVFDVAFNCIAVNGNTIFAGATSSSMGIYNGGFRSFDNGINWSKFTAMSPTDSSVLSIAASSNSLFVGTMNGIYSSTNNGTSWSNVSTGLPANPIVTALHFNGSLIFAGTYNNGIFLSTNGTNWSAMNSGIPLNEGITCVSSNSAIIFAGSRNSGKVYSSLNFGSSWTTNLISGLSSINSIAVSNSTIFTGGSPSILNNGRVYVSVDNGVNWSLINNGIISCPYVGALHIKSSDVFLGQSKGCSSLPNGVFKGAISSLANLPELFQSNNILIYPNPSEARFSFSNISSNSDLTLYNLLGEIIHFNKIISDNFTIDLQNQPSGIYIWTLKNSANSSVISGKIILRH